MDKIIFGITGGSGAGKTLVSQKFRKEGVFVVDTDSVSRKITKKGTKCLNELTEFFGNEILMPNGGLNRKRLGRIVFTDDKKLKKLNEITHKYIKEETLKMINESENNLCAVDGAVLIGSPLEEICTYMVCVIADKLERGKRIVRRDKLTLEDAKLRIESQPSDAFYVNNADFIIRNDKGVSEVENQVINITEALKRDLYE